MMLREKPGLIVVLVLQDAEVVTLLLPNECVLDAWTIKSSVLLRQSLCDTSNIQKVKQLLSPTIAMWHPPYWLPKEKVNDFHSACSWSKETFFP